jgi:hypothetical protein
MTILHSLSIIRLATAGLKILSKTTVWLQFSHKLKWKQLIPGSLVNKYKLDLLWLCLVPAKHLPFCKPVDAIRYRNMQGFFRRVIGLKYYGCFITSFVKMPIDAVF